MKKFTKITSFFFLSISGLFISYHLVPFNSIARDITVPNVKKSELSSMKTAEGAPIRLLTMGSDDAKLEIVEYSSLGCPHCAAFHLTRLPIIKKKYIDSNIAKITMHDIVDDQLSMQGSILLQCISDHDKALALRHKIFVAQSELMNMKNSSKRPSKAEIYQNRLQKITKLANTIGMDKNEAEQCIKAKASLRSIFDDMSKAFDEFKLQGTPTFIIRINKKKDVYKVINGTLTSEDIEEFLKVHEKEINLANKT